MKKVKCKSGLQGWQAKLQSVYHSLAEFRAYCGFYNLHARLGYATPSMAWIKNPTIQGSTDPSDFQKV